MRFTSLRARLIVIILTPLLVIALVAGAWQFRSTTQRAESIFDRGLLSAALAISRDVAVSDGDALSPATRRLVNDTSGGELFYHVYAPDGVFVTGYSTPPVLAHSASRDLTQPFFYDGRYQGEEVRVLRFQDVSVVSGVAGVFNITVWQSAQVRSTFVREVATRSFAVIAFLVVSAGVVVWFGVGLGLRPLLDLEQAIARRTPSELEPIRRRVPVEAQGLVNTLNTLLNRVSRRISSKDEFISNAAHQLRNPVAGVLALAEAVQNAPNAAAAKTRSAELVQAAREASALTNKLLSFERASGSDMRQTATRLDLKPLLHQAVSTFHAQQKGAPVSVDQVLPATAVYVMADPVMLQEAVLNLLGNAVVHGGPDMTSIKLHLSCDARQASLILSDNGVGIPPDKHVAAIGRFSQAGGGPGSGLGLPIAVRVMENHHGRLEILDPPDGAAFRLTLPLAERES
ncbi:sensor histidine kinase [uncultured Sulfitobacter sp.]|uniref:sensor histidine kinase n=1 Tax=uncultured Sulfitobacter sp. TaxID=191468 RepID=UPI0026228DAD|nr:sensor histidine kinase [uncultured Sulfitobacter sp.]